MSILIKGLNMPATMAVLIVIDNGEVCYKPLGNYGETGEWRRLDKYAVELPPHGRLIDADVLAEQYHYDDYDTAVIDLADLESAPTIIPADKIRRKRLLKGDCNLCLHGNELEDSDVCIECGISRKNYTPILEKEGKEDA